MRSKAFLLGLLGLGIAVIGCSDKPTPIDVDDATGTVTGVAYIDQDGDGAFDARFDLPATGTATALVLDGTTDTVARATAGANGSFIMRTVPVGRYQLTASRGTLGDSVSVLQIDSAHFVLPKGDTATRTIRLGFPVVTAVQLATQTQGRRITIEGIALNSWSVFADSTLHVFDGTATIRAIRVLPSAIAPGDSIRLIGTVGISNGRVSLVDATARVLSGSRGIPAIDSVGTGIAATADGGRLAFAQARIARAVIVDTSQFDGDRRVTVNDGSGPVVVVLDKNIAFNLPQLVPGATLQASGLLVPAPSGDTWQLKPRSGNDVTAVFPTSTVAQARLLASGTRVQITGKLLNSWNTYGDSTLHVLDATGAIRAIRVLPTNAIIGDSVRILGTTGVSNGRPVITEAAVTVLATAQSIPAADSISTAVAATADAAKRADGLARIGNAIIQDTTRLPSGDLQVGVDDGSGRLVVTLDAQISFDPGPYTPGALFRATGLLVPLTGGGWTLKPRERVEATISFPTITIAQARTFVLGRRVFVDGVAISRWNAFGDSTVHIIDSTGAMRAVRIVGTVSAGDSVRILGTLAIRNGARVLSNGTATVLRAQVGAPEPDSISTAIAASADAGKRDAAQVRVAGTVVGSQSNSTGDFVLTIDDGSGRLEVVIDAQSGISASGFTPGMQLRASGVLIPTGTGTWQLYPRTSNEITANFPTVTIAAARALPPGRTVVIVGLALNGQPTFGDQTVHVRDATASIRVLQLSSSSAVFQGDSIRVIGTISQQNGQPVLVASSASVLLTNIGVPTPDSVSTIAAARAATPVMDAGQARVRGRITNVQTSLSGETQLALNDGTGALTVVLDNDVGFSASFQIGSFASVRGVLIPQIPGSYWLMKPRSQSDVLAVAATDTGATSFRTTWREYVPGQQPAGWTTRWDRSTSFSVISEPQATDKQLLQWTGTNPTRDRFALAYDGVNDPANQEVYSEFRIRSIVSDTIDQRIGVVAVRIGGTSVDERGYAAFMGQSKDGTRKLVLGNFVAGAFVEIQSFTFAWSEDVFYSIRLEAIDDLVHARVWRRGTAEPETWQVTGSATRYASGRPGVVTQDSGTIQWDVFQVIVK